MSAWGFSVDIPCGATAESLVTFHCGQTIILGAGPNKTHARLLLTASLASLLPQRAKCPSLPTQAGVTLPAQTASSAETGLKSGVVPVLVSASSWAQRCQTSCLPGAGMGNLESLLSGFSGASGCAVTS